MSACRCCLVCLHCYQVQGGGLRCALSGRTVKSFYTCSLYDSIYGRAES